MDDPLLLTPGPVSVEDSVLETVAKPVKVHYGAEWVAFYDALATQMKAIFQTENEVSLITGPGSAALEMGFNSVAAAGETVIVVNNGFFGERMGQMVETYGINVVEVQARIEQPVSAEQVGPALDDHPDAVAVVVVHHDTTAGMQNDVASIAKLAHERDALCIVDAVSSVGGIDLPVDDWGVDICATVGNKCMSGLPGVAPIAVSPRAWDVVNSKQTPGWYLNLKTWRWYADNWGEWHPSPTTVATNTAYALATAAQAVLDEGLTAVFERHRQVAATVRQGLRDLGFEMYLPEELCSPVLTTVLKRPDMDIKHFSKWLLEEKGLMISGGLGDLAGKIFRVGHMGRAAHVPVAERFLSAVEAYTTTQL